jgi:putative transposase
MLRRFLRRDNFDESIFAAIVGHREILEIMRRPQLRVLTREHPEMVYRPFADYLATSFCKKKRRQINAKRVYRLAKLHKLLLQRYTGSSPMRVHEGTIAVEGSDQRYCSDGFEVGCDNGEKVRVTFSLDCCDRQAIAFAATTAGISGELVRDVMVQTLIERFGEVPELPHPAQWLSDNGSGYIARDARAFATDIGLIPCRTPYLLRGHENVKGEWNLVTMSWNIKRMFALQPC